MAFDDESFDTQAFSTDSWLFDLIAAARREVVRGLSLIARAISGESRL